MSTYAGEVRATLYDPNGDLSHLSEHLDHTPRFLFRAHSPKSSGRTTSKFVRSTGTFRRYVDVLHQDSSFSKAMIERHLTVWVPSEKDNFMSWTSSLLFALQHAIRREKTDFDPTSSAEEVKVSILDTSRLPRGTFMPAVALLEAYRIPSQGKLKHEWYHGEYLSQGKVDIPEGAMTTTTLKDLEDHGLYRFYPNFDIESEKRKLCLRVLELRQKFDRRDPRYQIEVPSLEEVDLAATLAEGCCANLRFRPVLFASLLSLKPRHVMERKILDKCDKLRWVWGSISDDMVESRETTSPEVPEHREFVSMMHDLQRRQQMLDGMYMRAVEKKNIPDTDITKALSRLQISPPKPTAGQESSCLTLNINVASSYYDPGPVAGLTASLVGSSAEAPKKKTTVTRRHAYINRSTSDDTENNKAVEQITQYASNSGPW